LREPNVRRSGIRIADFPFTYPTVFATLNFGGMLRDAPETKCAGFLARLSAA
jgi:hypothetical protein